MYIDYKETCTIMIVVISSSGIHYFIQDDNFLELLRNEDICFANLSTAVREHPLTMQSTL